jgi:hypothetical protein
MLTKLVHGRCFVAGTKVTLSEIPYSETRESDVWSEHDWYVRSADSFSPSPRFGEKGPGDEGQELSASSATTQTSNLLIPIEQVAIGSRVPTKNPRRWEYDFALPEPNESTWKRFSLTARDDEGAIVEAEFIRPDWWIEENRIAAGELMPLAIEELGLSGYATIQTVEDCGPIARGDGSVVTGRFTTSRVNVIVRLTVTGPDGTTEVLEGTTVHPIWSVNRNDWIQLSELQEGERLQAADGVATVVSIAIVSTNVPVYNIEVHGEHVYQVGELGLLVHNACNPLRDAMINEFGHPGPGWQAAHIIPKSGFSWAAPALASIQARVAKLGLIDDVANGFWSKPGHAGTHKAKYIDDVIEIMKNRTTDAQVRAGIDKLWDLIQSGNYK